MQEEKDEEMALMQEDIENGDSEEEDFKNDNIRVSFAERMMIHCAPDELKQQLKNSKNATGAKEAMDLIKQHLNQGEKGKEMLRKEILEFIVKGFEHIFKNASAPQEIEFKDLFKPQDEVVTAVVDPSWFQALFCMCFKGGNDDLADNYEIELRKSLVFGHPDLIKQIPMYSKTEIKNFSNNETHHVIMRNLKKLKKHKHK
jgi:hypothetical protein